MAGWGGECDEAAEIGEVPEGEAEGEGVGDIETGAELVGEGLDAGGVAGEGA